MLELLNLYGLCVTLLYLGSSLGGEPVSPWKRKTRSLLLTVLCPLGLLAGAWLAGFLLRLCS